MEVEGAGGGSVGTQLIEPREGFGAFGQGPGGIHHMA